MLGIVQAAKKKGADDKDKEEKDPDAAKLESVCCGESCMHGFRFCAPIFPCADCVAVLACFSRQWRVQL